MNLTGRIVRRMRYEYLKRFRNPAILETRMGVYEVPIGVDDPISKELFLFGEFELDLINEAMDLLRQLSGGKKGEGSLIDIGANNGVTSIGMLVTGQVANTVAIEPEPINYGRLKKNIQLNHLENEIYDINCALSDTRGELSFELSDINYGDHRVRSANPSLEEREIFQESERPVIKVPAETLDQLIAGLPERFTDDIVALWIDVQGYEGYVFRGARQLLSSGVPVVSEIWPYGIQRAGMSLQEFSALANDTWGSFWVKRRRGFARYPILAFEAFLDELGPDGEYENVIFTAS